MKNYKSSFSYIRRLAIPILLFLLVFPFGGKAQEDNSYDEVLVSLYVPHIGNLELPAIIKGQEAYLSVKELFDFLKII